MRWLVSALLASLLLSSPVSACPASAMSLRPVSTKNVTMVPDGGVLLEASRSYGQRPNGTYTLVDDSGNTIDAEYEPIAPGLVRFAPKQHADRELSMTEDGKPLFVVQDAAGAPAVTVVPKIARVTSTRKRDTKPRGPYPVPATTTITLASAPPAGVAGIVLYGADKQPRAWLRANRGRTYQLSFAGKGCGSVGMSGTIIGESVMFAFVDDTGRVSAMTKPVRVGRTPVPKPTPPKPMPNTVTTRPN